MPLVLAYPSLISSSMILVLKSPCTIISPSLADPPTPHLLFSSLPSSFKSFSVPINPVINPDASTSFLGTVQGMKYQGKSETEARNMAAISTKGRIQVQATLSALKEMAGWTIYGGLICMIFVLVVPYPKRKLLT